MERTSRPNVVWVTVDSVRADRTTMGGHHRDTTPNLQRIAADPGGDWFDTCIAQTRWTPASTASMLTGTYLSTHGVGVDSPEVSRLPDSLATMPELLADAGYESLGIATNQYVCSATGMDRGFDEFQFPTVRNLHRTVGLRAVADYARNIRQYGPGLSTDRSLHNISSMVTHKAKQWTAATADAETPVFLYVHYNGTHYPYTPPPAFLEPYAREIGQSVDEVLERSRSIFEDVFDVVAEDLPLSDDDFAAISAAYDAGVAYVDHLVGDLFDHVRERLPGETIVVVTGDHGEAFGEHGWLGHHVLVTDELLHVPMVTHGLPDTAGGTGQPVQHVDFTKTVLAAVGVDDDQLEGVDLASERRDYAVAQRAARDGDRQKLLARNPSFDADRYRWDALNCLHDGRFKYVTGEAGSDLFALPDEETDRAGDYPSVAAAMASELDARMPSFATGGDGQTAAFDDRMRERLADMGYI
ncbi:sulfatase-like hydrolase/transferase [Haloarcula litorea]|uniref:sulfatase-like hydrolase/transferase n=1 Tax=Haloarcula litorea TaxID=3032579 RepID=UPI0023E84B06|nr:sulfatase-like hydrolase/transferase [Halomicroarcula sp. GDY20]